MKLQGYLKGSGKLGNMVVARVAGETIARDYNPNVANPNTNLQVGQRSRFKLASQVSAALAPIIAIPRQGLKSARNLFVKKNFENFVKVGDNSAVNLTALQITAGSIAVPVVEIARTSSNITVNTVGAAPEGMSRMVYCLYKVNANQQLAFVQSIIAEDPATDDGFPATFPAVAGQILLLAYGIYDADASASAKYADYAVQSAQDIAQLVATRALSTTDFRFTKTAGIMLQSGDDSGTSVIVPSYIVSVTAGNGGTATASNNGIIPEGSSCTITATPAQGYAIDVIKVNGVSVGSTSPYTFTPSGNTAVQVDFLPVT